MKLISSVLKYKNSLFSVTEDHAVDPDGFEIKRGIVHHRGSAVMMAVDEKKRILTGAAIPFAGARNIYGNCPPEAWMKAKRLCAPQSAS